MTNNSLTNNNIICPFCNSAKTKKEGKRKNKLEIIQKYSCKSCNKNFTNKKLKHKTYPIKIILNTISYYHLGYTQQQTSKLINQRYKIKVPQRTISSWINQYKTICTFNKLRGKALKLYKPNNIIFSKKLQHNQVYLFKYHKAKLHLLFHNIKYNNQFTNLSKFYEPIKSYLKKIPTEKFPHHIFKKHSSEADIAKLNNINNKEIISNENNSTSASEQYNADNLGSEAEISQINNNVKNKNSNIEIEQRISQLKIKTLPIIKLSKNNTANKLTNLALNLAKTNKDRHNAIQNFFLINDSTTIAVEIPVYLTNDDIKYFKKRNFILNLENYQTPITGHIDIMQIRNGLIHILDYKPDADKIEAIQQLTLYALALASRTKLDLHSFKCAWFDEKNYYEFFPLHAVYAKR